MAETKETTKTIEERIEQNAHDIVAACERVRKLTDGYPHGTPEHRINRAALHSQFHAEGILVSDDEDES